MVGQTRRTGEALSSTGMDAHIEEAVISVSRGCSGGRSIISDTTNRGSTSRIPYNEMILVLVGGWIVNPSHHRVIREFFLDPGSRRNCRFNVFGGAAVVREEVE